MNTMKLEPDDIAAIGKLIDQKLDQKLEEKLDIKLRPIYEFIDFAKPALLALLDESQTQFDLKLPERLKKLENIHPGGQHSS